MTTVQDIYRFIDQVAPFAIQESWDNAGMLVGHWKRPVQKILVTLDITPEVVYEAEKVGADLIVAHHPILFHPAKQVTDGGMDLVGQRVLALAERGIAAICCHTNWDSAQGGVNYVLAKLCGLAANPRSLAAGQNRLRAQIKLPERLSACGVEGKELTAALDGLAEAAQADLCAPSNPRPAAAEDLKSLLRELA